jgi:hypothetical protein
MDRSNSPFLLIHPPVALILLAVAALTVAAFQGMMRLLYLRYKTHPRMQKRKSGPFVLSRHWDDGSSSDTP